MGYLDGFGVTLRKLAGVHTDSGRRVTGEYPEETRPKPERFHGRHVLNRYDDGMEKCIGCELCAGVCPARCIYVRGRDNDPDDPTSPGERYGYIYEINYLRCIHCDLCVEACPTEAITETKMFEFAFSNRSDAIYTKAELVVDDDGQPQHLPWENWEGGFDAARDTSGWMRATAPGGDAEFVGIVAWAGELGYGVRPPERIPGEDAAEDGDADDGRDGHGDDRHGDADDGRDGHGGDGHGAVDELGHGRVDEPVAGAFDLDAPVAPVEPSRPAVPRGATDRDDAAPAEGAGHFEATGPGPAVESGPADAPVVDAAEGDAGRAGLFDYTGPRHPAPAPEPTAEPILHDAAVDDAVVDLTVDDDAVEEETVGQVQESGEAVPGETAETAATDAPTGPTAAEPEPPSAEPEPEPAAEPEPRAFGMFDADDADDADDEPEQGGGRGWRFGRGRGKGDRR